MASEAPKLNLVGEHIINTLRAVHDQSVVKNVEAVDQHESHLSGQTELESLMFINSLEFHEVTVLANRIKSDPSQLLRASRTLQAFRAL